MVLNNDNTEARKIVESCYKKHKTMVNPIIDWSDDDVWGFIHGESIPYCELYNEGRSRLGCIGCPMAGQRQREQEFGRWPKYQQAYTRAFAKMVQVRREKGLDTETKYWRTAQDVFNWWMEYDILPGQMDLFEDYDAEMEMEVEE